MTIDIIDFTVKIMCSFVLPQIEFSKIYFSSIINCNLVLSKKIQVTVKMENSSSSV